jgi:hypothetical protein
MKKLIVSCIVFLTLSLSVSKAKTIDYLVTGTAGGSAYDNAELFIPILEKETGYKINKIIVDSCVGATIYLKSSKNPSIFRNNTLQHESEIGCDLTLSKNSFIGTAWGRAMSFCSMDDLATAVAKLKGGKRLTFAVSNSYGQHMIDPLAELTGTPMTFVPYGSSGKSLKGFVAGDTDMLYTNMPKAVSGVMNNGITCWANTGPTKILDMVPMRDLFPEYKYNDIQTFTYVNSANMSSSDVKKFRKAWDRLLESEEVTTHIENKKLFHPSLYGKNPDWVAILDKAGKNWVGK